MPLTTRYSLRELQNGADNGDEQFKKKLNDFLKAWRLIQQLPPSNPNSFWSIASYHGMPFKERRVEPLNPTTNAANFWDGYCQHGNVLFPTWHRFYCLRIEQALQTVLPEGDVALHYWDETSEQSKFDGLPDLLIKKTVIIDGEEVDNPLRSFTLPKEIPGSPKSIYVKPVGYTTTRYPFSGIRNPMKEYEVAKAHDKKIMGLDECPDQMLQDNIIEWITNGSPHHVDHHLHQNSVYNAYKECLDTDNYNQFSNTNLSIHNLEQPHNSIHLAVGGFTLGKTSYGIISGSNGDMGANEVASFDPIFFLHHCNVDRMFWIWQKKWHKTKIFEINPSSVSTQGATPNQVLSQDLNINTILYPYQDELGVPRTSRDCIDIEKQLGYTYSIGSLDKEDWGEKPLDFPVFSKVIVPERLEDTLGSFRRHVKSRPRGMKLHMFINLTEVGKLKKCSDELQQSLFSDEKRAKIEDATFDIRYIIQLSNLDRNAFPGSFAVQVFKKAADGTTTFVGQRGVLDRWNRENCKNCQRFRHATVSIYVPKPGGNFIWNPDEYISHIVKKNPSTGKDEYIPIDLHSHKDNNKPIVEFFTMCKEINILKNSEI